MIAPGPRANRLIRILLVVAVGVTCATEPAQSGDIGTLLNNITRRNIKTINVSRLVAMTKASDSQVFVFDADPAGHQATEGIIPGAFVLSSCNHYDPSAELPKDKSATLIFYCYTFW